MSRNAQKTHFQKSLHEFGDIKSQDWLDRQQKTIPATVHSVQNALVKVDLPGKWNPFQLPGQILVPKVESQWMRYPTQPGDKGALIAFDFYIGGQTDLGGGQADLYPRANLTNVAWVPLSNKNWPAVDNNQHTITGKNGVLLTTTDGQYYINIEDNKIVIRVPASSTLYLGGDPDKDGGTYAFVQTVTGPSINVKARTG